MLWKLLNTVLNYWDFLVFNKVWMIGTQHNNLNLLKVNCFPNPMNKIWEKNPAYGRHRISWTMRKVAPMFLFPLVSKKGMIAFFLPNFFTPPSFLSSPLMPPPKVFFLYLRPLHFLMYIFSGPWCHGGRQLCSPGTSFVPLGESHGNGTSKKQHTDSHGDY